ncbi:MAG: flavin reductase family protein [Akkermansiaceae bacterium]
MKLGSEEIAGMEKLARVQLATTLPGAKPICLVGTASEEGDMNLAPFSSVTHLGSNPMLIGMVTRPDVVDRHTLRNIIASKSWTLNHLVPEMIHQAHQCSARYPDDVSEFEATGLTPHFIEGFHAPFVEGSPVRYALELEDIIEIPANGTKLIVGKVTFIEIQDSALNEDGELDLVNAGSVASTALDTYFGLKTLAKLAYAKA